MAIVSLLFRKARTTQILRTVNGSQTPMILDATVKEAYKGTSQITKHPVEGGADVSDGFVTQPGELSLSGVITTTPFPGLASSLLQSVGATIGSQVGKSLGKFGGVVGAVGAGLGVKSLANAIFGETDRELSAIAAEFEKLREAKQPVDIQTGLKLYKNYGLTSFSLSRDQKTGAAIQADLEFQEIIFADSKSGNVAIPALAGALQKLGLGRQAASALDDTANGRGASVLKKLFGGSP
jgi:hypothetical protein